MSHRTDPLPPLQGLPRIVRELRYHEASRQIGGILICIVVAVTATREIALVVAGTPVVLTGVGIRLWASGVIEKNRQLATGGPYRYLRHPLYAGNILILAAFVVASGRWWAVLLATGFLLFYYPPAIEYEERKLRRTFGPAWDVYARDTNRLLPSFTAPPERDRAGWRLRNSLALNLEPLIAVLIIALYASLFRT